MTRARSDELRGGLSGNSGNTSVLDKARQALATRGKRVSLDFLRAKPAAREDDGRLSAGAFGAYAKDLASGAYDFVLNTAKPFLRKLERDVADIGPEVLSDRCSVSDQSNASQRDDYEGALLQLQLYGPDEDGVLREEWRKAEEAGDEHRKEFILKMCLRVAHSAQIALLIDAVCNASSKNELEDIIANAKESIRDDARKVFVQANAQSQNSEEKKRIIWAFGKPIRLADDVFGIYHEFARERLAEAVANRSRDLAKKHKQQEESRKKKISEADQSGVSCENLLFGNPNEVDEKTALFSWNFQGRDNGIKLRRSGNRLYVVDAFGKPGEELQAMRMDRGKEPHVPLKSILAKDGKHLCPEEAGRYRFSEFVHQDVFCMVRWVRTAAGNCIPSRVMSATDACGNSSSGSNGQGKPPIRERPVKPAGELLTNQEFLYQRGLGDYNLVYETGFHYEPRDEKGEPTGESFAITEQALAKIERKSVNGKDKIALKSVSSQELIRLLSSGGAEAEHEFFEGKKGSALPLPLRLGISQAYARLKISETQAQEDF